MSRLDYAVLDFGWLAGLVDAMIGTDKCILEGLSNEQSERDTHLVAMPSMHT